MKGLPSNGLASKCNHSAEMITGRLVTQPTVCLPGERVRDSLTEPLRDCTSYDVDVSDYVLRRVNGHKNA